VSGQPCGWGQQAAGGRRALPHGCQAVPLPPAPSVGSTAAQLARRAADQPRPALPAPRSRRRSRRCTFCTPSTRPSSTGMSSWATCW
jgi:hypothetical protein